LVRKLQGELACRRGDLDGARHRWADAAEQFAAQGRMAESWGPRAELAALDAGAGRVDEARAAISAVLAEAGAQDAGPHLRVMAPSYLLACLRVCEAIGDPRAAALREALRARLEEQRASLPDDDARRLLVTAVPHWREVHKMR